MNRYVIIATRHTEEECADSSTNVGKLNRYLEDAGWTVKFMRNCKSIFEAYSNAIKELQPEDEDRIILCHDDIEVLYKTETFNEVVNHWLDKEKCGIVGVAGAPILLKDSNWVSSFKKSKREAGGSIWHGNSMTDCYMSFYGNATQAVQVDGVFMATTGKVLKNIELRKPKVFESNWHWYDAYYCIQAHLKGYNNYIMPLTLRHDSGGNYDQLYFADKNNFNKLFGKYLPVVVRKLQK